MLDILTSFQFSVASPVQYVFSSGDISQVDETVVVAKSIDVVYVIGLFPSHVDPSHPVCRVEHTVDLELCVLVVMPRSMDMSYRAAFCGDLPSEPPRFRVVIKVLSCLLRVYEFERSAHGFIL